ncbi:MAG: nuclear transport factor 2 family protein [Acidimicrobiia bacterium]
MTDRRLDDRAALADLLADYAWSLTDQDWDRWLAVFADGATVDYSTAGGPTGSAGEAAAWLKATFAMFDVALGQGSNLTISFDADDRATLRSLYVMTMRIPATEGGQPTYLQASGWYDDVAVLTAGGWRLASRREQLCYVKPV